MDMMTIQDKQKRIVDEFSKIDAWEDRYKLLIQKGKALPPLPAEIQIEKYKVKGCQSNVWMHARKDNGKIIFVASSDAMIVQGLIALLLEVYSGHTPEDIMTTPAKFIEDIGINTHLSQARANGLAAMLKQMKLYAFALGQI